MPNPYEFIVSQPEMIMWYGFALLMLAAWVFFSYRKMFKWVSNVKSASGRWDMFLLPPDDLTYDIAGILAFTGLNLALIGLFMFLVL